MIHIELYKQAGEFAGDKDLARSIRSEQLIPALENNQKIILDFTGVQGATQSFIHALISDLFRKYGNDILDMMEFKSCNDNIKGIITIVVDYMQESDI